MSVGYPIDVNRIINDNQRYQRDLSYSQHQQQQLHLQLDKALALNHQLKEDCIRLQRQNQQELDSFIANHRQIYQAQLANLTQQNQSLSIQIQKCKKTQKQQFQIQITDLQEQLNKQTTMKNQLEEGLRDLRRTMFQNQKGKQKVIKELQDKIGFLEDSQSKRQKYFAKLQQQCKQSQWKYQQLQQSSSSLVLRYNTIIDATPKGIIEQLFELRNQNVRLLNSHDKAQLQLFANDQNTYNLIKKLHQELAILRYELNQAKNSTTEIDLSNLQQREAFSNERANLQLNIIKLEREIAIMKEERQRQAKNIDQLQFKQKKLQDEVQKRVKVEQELALLQIKLFIVESLKDTQTNRDYRLKQMDSKHSETNSLQQLTSQAINKLKQQESKRRQLSKKVKQYKSRCQSLSKTESELLRMVEHSRAKEQEYRQFIEKMQRQLQSSYQANNHMVQTKQNDRNDLPNNSISSYQRTIFKNQIDRTQQSIEIQKSNHIKQVAQLKRLITHLQSNVSQLQDNNHKLQAKILEQALTLPNKNSKNYQIELAEKTNALILAETQLQKLRNQIDKELQINNERTLAISQLTLKVESLNRLIHSQSKSREDQISQLKQKNAYLQGMLEQKRNSDGNRILALREQIVHLKTQSNDFKQDTIDRSDRAFATDKEVQSYRKRLLQLQQALRVINSENEEKSLQIFRLNKENHILSKDLDKLQEQLDTFRDKTGSLRQFELIDKNRDLQQDIQAIKRKYAEALQAVDSKQAQAQSLRRQCDQAWKNNLQLTLKISQYTAQINQNQKEVQSNKKQLALKHQQLQNKISSLQNENGLLKKQVEELRFTILEKQHKKVQQDKDQWSNSPFLSELQGKNRQIRYLQLQLDRILEQRMKQKQSFDQQWNQLSSQLKQIKQFQYSYLHTQPTANQQVHNITNQHTPINLETKSLLDKINMIQNLLALKNEQINYLQLQKRQGLLSIDHKDIYTNELVEARNQNHSLLQIKFNLQNRVRVLQQENSLLKIRKISEQLLNNEVFSQETFGPSLGSSQLIKQLKQADRQPYNQNKDSLLKRQQQSLCLLVMAWAEIESLRTLILEIQQKSDKNYGEYINKLRVIQDNGQLSENQKINFELIKQLQCGHHHIVQIGQRLLKDRPIDLAQMRTFAESIPGAKLIESYSIGEDQSRCSQDYIPI